MTKYLSKYFDQRCDQNLNFEFKSLNNIDVIIIIPCFNEDLECIKSTLTSLDKQDCTIAFHILILINYKSSDPKPIIEESQGLYSDLNELRGSFKNINYNLFMAELQGKKAGVGMARKMLMDLAFRFFYAIEKNGIIVNLDADTTVSENYVEEIHSAFNNNDKGEAASISYRHPIENWEENQNQLAALNYELHLRYFVNMQKLIHLPYAFQTVGSAMAVRAYAYAKEGGMNQRQAGEDFYFLHKYSSKGTLFNITTAQVFPSTRTSDRVPFGTGKAISDALKETENYPTSYNPKSFYELQKWILNIFNQYPSKAFRLPDHSVVTKFIVQRNETTKLSEIYKHSSNFEGFKKRFFQWFDVFLLMKYLHFCRDKDFSNLPVNSCTEVLLKALNLKSENNSYKLLQTLRKMDKTDFSMSTDRTHISLLNGADLDEAVDLFSEEGVLNYIGPLAPLTKEQHRLKLKNKIDQIHPGTTYHWAARLKSNQELIGVLNFNPMPGSDKPFIGYIIKKAYWQQGYGKELAKWIIEFANANLDYPALYALIEDGNIASQRILKGLGFREDSFKMEEGYKLITLKLD